MPLIPGKRPVLAGAALIMALGAVPVRASFRQPAGQEKPKGKERPQTMLAVPRAPLPVGIAGAAGAGAGSRAKARPRPARASRGGKSGAVRAPREAKAGAAGSGLAAPPVSSSPASHTESVPWLPTQGGPFAFHRHISISQSFRSSTHTPSGTPPRPFDPLGSPISQASSRSQSRSGTLRAFPGEAVGWSAPGAGRGQAAAGVFFSPSGSNADPIREGAESSQNRLDAAEDPFNSPPSVPPTPGLPDAAPVALPVATSAASGRPASTIARRGSPPILELGLLKEVAYRNQHATDRMLRYESLHAESEVIWIAVKGVDQDESAYQDVEPSDGRLAIRPGQMVRIQALEPSEDLEFWIEEAQGAWDQDLELRTLVGGPG